MNGAARELRRPWGYVAAVLVGAGALLVGLPWYAALAIAVVALLAGALVAIWTSGRAARPAKVRQVTPTAEPVPATLRLEGDYWTIAYRDATFRLHDAKGLGYLHRLLAAPNQELHVLDLVVGVQAAPATVRSHEELPAQTTTAEPVLDRQAREAYGRRIEELRDEIEEAEANGDPERASRARGELDFIADELHKHIRPDGSSRTAPDATERARVNVSRAIRASIAKIAEQDASLGHHLDHDIRTGIYCSYVPDPSATPVWGL